MNMSAHDALKVVEGFWTKLQAHLAKPEEALKLVAPEVEWIEHAGYELIDRGDFGEARKLFLGLAAYTDLSFYAYVLGVIAEREGNFQEALEQFTACARANPKADKPLYARGLVLAQTGRDAEARVDLEMALKLDPEHTDPRAKFAQAILAAEEEGR